MYTGVVFDFDGVLYDSEKHWDVIENEYLMSRIPDWKPEYYKELIGRSLPEAYLHLREKGLTLTEAQYSADYHNMADRLYAKFAQPLEGVDVLLNRLKFRNRKLAIASSSKHAWINAALQGSPLPFNISIIVSAEDELITKGKPAPDVYLMAAKLVDESPSRLIAIEDSRNGLLSAKAAGLYCIGLRNGFNESQDLNSADEIIYGYSPASIKRVMDLLS